jgi:hypothetical protein
MENRRCIFNLSDYDFFAIECGYTERLTEEIFDFSKFREDYGFENIEFFGNVNHQNTYPKKNIKILKNFFNNGTLIFKKKDNENIDFGNITSLIYNINNEYDFCSCMDCKNIYDIIGYTINLNIDNDIVDNIVKVLHIKIDTESG